MLVAQITTTRISRSSNGDQTSNMTTTRDQDLGSSQVVHRLPTSRTITTEMIGIALSEYSLLIT